MITSFLTNDKFVVFKIFGFSFHFKQGLSWYLYAQSQQWKHKNNA